MISDAALWKIVISALIGLIIIRFVFQKTKFIQVSETTKKSILEIIDSFIMAGILVFFIIRPFIVQAFYIPSDSMLPTLQRGDRILVNKFVYRFKSPQRGDVIVFPAPPQALSNSDYSVGNSSSKKDFIKRLIGLPNDTIEVQGGAVYINGKKTKENYIMDPPMYEYGPFKVPPGKLFVMGDNRNNSNDSHFWGPLAEERVLGKAMVIFWPPKRVRIIR